MFIFIYKVYIFINMKQEFKDYECPYCHNHFIMKRGGFSNHMRYCKDNPNSNNNKLQNSIKQKEYLAKQKELEKETEKEYIFICQECGQQYTLILTDKQYNNHKYSNFCSLSCARKYASHQVNKNNDLKEAKCIDCGKTLYIKKRASNKNCRCENCKLIHSEPLKNVLFVVKNLEDTILYVVQKNVQKYIIKIENNIYPKKQYKNLEK